MERMHGKQAVLDNPDLVSPFEPIKLPDSSVFMKPYLTLPSLELVCALTFGPLPEEELESADGKNPLHKEAFCDGKPLVPSLLEQPQINGLLSPTQAPSKTESASERKETIDMHESSEAISTMYPETPGRLARLSSSPYSYE
ncbi:5b404a38-4723-4fe2-b2fd-11d2ecf3d8b7 [Sclerotinia trifoliorum]|uniref:5b404a38-4723-4fe2-b2fd-11d2ecf3d8b7 n=1 Tax=Sclerotinia trifoliorum TaxID=28548 RepID=A0A8H2ZPF6_9HELO|nr:5b404a38-4723-4fe2-b2fd-11d2ecf3d8b7 [Sclerotinia trifoliorum]